MKEKTQNNLDGSEVEPRELEEKIYQNKRSIQWTPDSQIYRSNQKIIFSKK